MFQLLPVVGDEGSTAWLIYVILSGVKFVVSIVDVVRADNSLLCDVSDTMFWPIVFGVVITYVEEFSVTIVGEEASFADVVSIGISELVTSD